MATSHQVISSTASCPATKEPSVKLRRDPPLPSLVPEQEVTHVFYSNFYVNKNI